MSVTICPKCEHKQQGGEECQACGLIFARYRGAADQSSGFAARQQWEEDIIETPLSPWRRYFRIIRWIWLCCGVVGLFLMFSVPEAPAVDEDSRALEQAQRKVATAIEASRSRIPYRLRLSEAEINAILRFGMAHADEAAQQDLNSVRDIRIKISQDRLHCYFLVNRLGKNFALALTGLPALEDGYLTLHAESGRLGYCPMLTPVLNFTLSWAMTSGANRDELRLPSSVKAVRIESNELVVYYNHTGEGDEGGI